MTGYQVRNTLDPAAAERPPFSPRVPFAAEVPDLVDSSDPVCSDFEYASLRLITDGASGDLRKRCNYTYQYRDRTLVTFSAEASPELVDVE